MNEERVQRTVDRWVASGYNIGQINGEIKSRQAQGLSGSEMVEARERWLGLNRSSDQSDQSGQVGWEHRYDKGMD